MVFPKKYVLCSVFHDDANINLTHISEEFVSTFLKLGIFGFYVFSDCLWSKTYFPDPGIFREMLFKFPHSREMGKPRNEVTGHILVALFTMSCISCQIMSFMLNYGIYLKSCNVSHVKVLFRTEIQWGEG
jgi:hypothetical protein